MTHAIAQIRLAIAEKLIQWAMDIAPPKHPDSVAIYEAALHVSRRKPS